MPLSVAVILHAFVNMQLYPLFYIVQCRFLSHRNLAKIESFEFLGLNCIFLNYFFVLLTWFLTFTLRWCNLVLCSKVLLWIKFTRKLQEKFRILININNSWLTFLTLALAIPKLVYYQKFRSYSSIHACTQYGVFRLSLYYDKSRR